MRVVGGALGGRRLTAPQGMATRPTSDRVREALFNVLGPLGGAVVLDLYAGTGALAIEALSRGASRAVLVESGRPALASIRQNVDALGLKSRVQVLAQPVLRALPNLSSLGPFDLVLLDPPYAALEEASVVLTKVVSICSPSAVLVLEHASRDAPPEPDALRRVETRVYGDTAISLYELRELSASSVPKEDADE